LSLLSNTYYSTILHKNSYRLVTSYSPFNFLKKFRYFLTKPIDFKSIMYYHVFDNDYHFRKSSDKEDENEKFR